MSRIAEILLTDIRHLIADLGAGGLIGPSIYDTAQVIRLAPPLEGAEQALDWLLTQQHPDGGWGSPAVPLARDVPTLAAVLALHELKAQRNLNDSIEAGLALLGRQAAYWSDELSDDLPVGIELLLPKLLEEAAAAGLSVPTEHYSAIIKLGMKRRKLIASLPLRSGSTPAHSWEAFGVEPDPALLDHYGSIGHNPAATAAWLRRAQGRDDLAEARAAARRYLDQATIATGVNIPGVVPTAWPITRFEQSNTLYAVLIGGMIDHPALQSVLQPQIDDMAQAMRHDGIGFSDYFDTDGDDTAEALAVLVATGRTSDPQPLQRFATDTHFAAYPGELQPSPSVTAHAIHTLDLCGHDTSAARAYLLERQLPDGRWLGDKWNGSWLYTTCQALVALNKATDTPTVAALQRSVSAILAHQHSDGSWGDYGANAEETAYAVLALRAIAARFPIGPHLERGQRWLLANYRPFEHNRRPIWLAKEIYCPQRLSRMIELVATYPPDDVLKLNTDTSNHKSYVHSRLSSISQRAGA
jgi:Squalene-hopene cyclase C-terminal domain/Prenyltransferase and squalene oxidase repeat